LRKQTEFEEQLSQDSESEKQELIDKNKNLGRLNNIE